ncbi:3362_t:CDS:2 [Paraglomus brasilianum]|uniref:3362_t:CDS:1 n=1 Tax=Paraglomus brasilianum TaxID=144538 RepID=A0A9N9GR15_9GLOM|nr:3362_t:CDS:2 [Paraglomus brasilianum]
MLAPFVIKHYGSLQQLTDYCRALPKVELHAHINGSISRETCQKLINKKKLTNSEFADFVIPDYELEDIFGFFPIFSKFIYKLTTDTESISFVTKEIINDFMLDGVKYLELRTIPRACLESAMTRESYVQAVLSCLELFTQDEIIVKLILGVDRRNSLEEAMETVDLAIKYQQMGIVGVDLCGNPSAGNIEELLPAFVKAKENGLGVTIHLGEIPSSVSEHSSLITIPPDRIGHGTYLDPLGKEFLIKNNIPIEMCMTSNVLCKTVKKFEDHHIKEFLDLKHPCVLGTDDKGIFLSDLSMEYGIAASTFSLTQRQLYELSYQSIDYIFSNNSTKESLKAQWNAWWKQAEYANLN